MTDKVETNPTVADLLARARVYAESSHAKQTSDEGLLVTLRRSKTDQEGQTMMRGVTAAAMAGVSERIQPFIVVGVTTSRSVEPG